MNQEKYLLDKGMLLLQRREHSARELKYKLSRYCSDSALVENTLLELQNRGYLSNQRFTENYTHARASRGFGMIRIALELKEKGVSAEQIDQTFRQLNYDWVGMANAVREKRFGLEIPNDQTEKWQQIKFLQYRGFTQEQINQVFSLFC